MDVVLIQKSLQDLEKLDAIFKDKVVSFGAKNFFDFTLTKNEKDKENYIKRH
jgi:hypothetical protein